MARTLVQELNDMHATYVEAVNIAIGEDDFYRAEALASEYDDEAIQLIAEREGLTHLLPIKRPSSPDTPLRRLVARVRMVHAA